MFDEWLRILTKEFGVTDVWDAKQLTKIPQSYNSDIWWIKAKLNLKLKQRKDALEEYRQNLIDREWEENEINNFVALEKKRVAGLGDTCCTRLHRYKYGTGCCPTYPEKKCFECPIQYEPEKRQFKLLNHSSGILLHKNKKYRILAYDIFFCPWCGKKMQHSLAKEWAQIVCSKFGVKNIFQNRELEKIPKNFRTEI